MSGLEKKYDKLPRKRGELRETLKRKGISEKKNWPKGVGSLFAEYNIFNKLTMFDSNYSQGHIKLYAGGGQRFSGSQFVGFLVLKHFW